MRFISSARCTFLAVFIWPWACFAQTLEAPAEFMVCFDFSCKSSMPVQLSPSDWSQVTSLFDRSAVDSRDERQRMRQGVALMETLVGNHTPTHVDVAGNWPLQDSNELESGHMDCIDESINATTYLQLLEDAGLLRHHLVRKRAYRQSLFNQHWAAQFVDTGTGKYFVIDSWFQDNGELPVLVSGKSWHDLSRF